MMHQEEHSITSVVSLSKIHNLNLVMRTPDIFNFKGILQNNLPVLSKSVSVIKDRRRFEELF
jgi:hypothetical protein